MTLFGHIAYYYGPSSKPADIVASAAFLAKLGVLLYRVSLAV